MTVENLILGAGVTGLAAGAMLKSSTIILEKEDRAGGLVKSKCFDGGYWFDNVLHLLHFNDEEIRGKIKELMGDLLHPCSPEAWIVTPIGTLKYPFQLNIGAIDNEEERINCLNDYEKAYYNKSPKKPNNYKEYLQSTFGESMCKLFYFPYNEKLYKYPLEKISCGNIIWNLHRPSYEEVLKGTLYPNQTRTTYNSDAFYPRPPEGAKTRGMEVLSISLAEKIKNIEYNCEIYRIDPLSKTVYAKKDGKIIKYNYQNNLLSTIPLPFLIEMCDNAPEDLKDKCRNLRYTKVISIGLSIKGKRPKNPGLWRYYTSPDIPFTRLIFMTEFDSLNAPKDGWSLLAEVTVGCEDIIENYSNIEEAVVEGIKKIDLLEDNSEIIGIHSWIATPAYVIFTHETEKIINECRTYLRENGISSLGRYGNWEYSSIFKNIKEGYNWASNFNNQ